MITRLYAHNFRSLVNFEITFEQLALLMGANGAGKSSVLDVLQRLVSYLADGAKVEDVFPSTDFTRWNRHVAPVQRFELDVTCKGHPYHYELEIDHNPDRHMLRMSRESLSCDGKGLFSFSVENGNGEAQLYRDDGSAGPKYPFDWSQSGVGFMQPRHDNRLLTAFRERMASVFVVRPAPQIMRAESRRELKRPDLLMEDFASWLRYLMQEHQGRVYELTSVLRRVIPRFSSFSLREAGDARMLHVEVRSPGDALDLCRFDSLSHGERMLIALYTLLGCMPDEDVTICIDEPENFLALPEVQPWLDALRDRLEEHDTCQALLVSHHPRLINFLTAAKAGVWLSRKGDLGPSNAVTVSPDASKDGIPVADLIERGWLYDA